MTLHLFFFERQVVRSIADLLDETLRPKLLMLLPGIFKCVRHFHVAVRLAASRCITSMAKSMTMNVMGSIIENVVPMLGDMTSVHARQGAGMLVSLLVQGLGVELVPYAPLLVVPLLRCMSDCDHSVRQSVTHSFAALVPLLPLARGLTPPAFLSESLSRNKEDAKFLEQLVDNSHIDDYKLSTQLKVTLRRYSFSPFSAVMCSKMHFVWHAFIRLHLFLVHASMPFQYFYWSFLNGFSECQHCCWNFSVVLRVHFVLFRDFLLQ